MPFVFNSDCIEAFNKLKDWLIFSPVFCYYNLDLKLMLEMDPSNRVIVGILLQLYLDGEWYPITFFLKIINLAKCNYKIHNKEMLAII